MPNDKQLHFEFDREPTIHWTTEQSLIATSLLCLFGLLVVLAAIFLWR